MIKFKSAPNTRDENDVIEIWMDDVMVAAIYPFGSDAIRVSGKAISQGSVTIEPPSTLLATGVIIKMHSESIVCPQCGLRSYHPVDIKERYCSRCHQFYADMKK